MSTDPTSALRVAAAALIGQIAHWTPSRYAAAASVSVRNSAGRGAAGLRPVSADGAPPTNADVLHALAQYLADVATGVEGVGRRTVPRLDVDLALPDQLTVLTADLVATRPGPAALSQAATVVEELRRAL